MYIKIVAPEVDVQGSMSIDAPIAPEIDSAGTDDND